MFFVLCVCVFVCRWDLSNHLCVQPPAPGADSKGKGKKRRKCRPTCWTATGFVLDPARRKQMKAFGARVVDEWSSKVTHVVARSFRRTTKLMCAVCAGIRVVLPSYIDACLAARDLVDDSPFLLKDTENEASFAQKHGLPPFSLQASIGAASSKKLLSGRSVYCFGNPAERQELQALVEAAGGRWLKRKPRKDGALLLGKDYALELLREAACTQVLRLDAHKL
ncbi:unnamed protein product [Effrenium voratum]|nr:unnamed protein product [Effrenium voratum]